MRPIAALFCCALSGPAFAQTTGVPEWAIQFHDDVQRCWTVTEGDIPWPSVTVGFEMTSDGNPVVDSMTLLTASPADEEVTFAAFAAARRAVIRCAAIGYDLPADLYDQWKVVELTFDPRSEGDL